jgi:hypothetical protein
VSDERLFDQMLASRPVARSLLNEVETVSDTARRIWFGQRDRRCIYPPTPAPPELQEKVFNDIAVQLVTRWDIAAKDTFDSTRLAYILADCDRMCDIYSRAGFYQLAKFQTELRSDLPAALHKARERAASSPVPQGSF